MHGFDLPGFRAGRNAHYPKAPHRFVAFKAVTRPTLYILMQLSVMLYVEALALTELFCFASTGYIYYEKRQISPLYRQDIPE